MKELLYMWGMQEEISLFFVECCGPAFLFKTWVAMKFVDDDDYDDDEYEAVKFAVNVWSVIRGDELKSCQNSWNSFFFGVESEGYKSKLTLA